MWFIELRCCWQFLCDPADKSIQKTDMGNITSLVGGSKFNQLVFVVPITERSNI